MNRVRAWQSAAGPKAATMHSLELRCKDGEWKRGLGLPDYGLCEELAIREGQRIVVWQLPDLTFAARGFDKATAPVVERLLARLDADPRWKPQWQVTHGS